MKRTAVLLVGMMLILSAMGGAAVNDLAMSVGSNQATKLMAGSPEYQQMADMYNLIENPKAAITQTAMAAIGKEAPGLYKAYQIISSPSSFIEGSIKSEICDSNKELCSAYDKGMQVKSAAQDPQNAAKQYALQEIAKQDPKIGGQISQAFMIKSYVDLLRAGPAGKNEAAAAAQKGAAMPAAPTGAAVTDPFEGKFAQESIQNCIIGFSLGETKPGIGDIKNCQVNSEVLTDISFIFGQEGIVAKVAGKGGTFSKTGTKVYLYNADSCAITADQWIIPQSGKGTYIVFDKKEESIEMVEGRFIPRQDNQEFKFEERGYKIPLGGVLYYKDGKFDLDLTNAKTKSVLLKSYGKLPGETTVNQFGKTMTIRKTPLGFEVSGDDIEVINQFNKIKSSGTINVDSRGVLSGIGEQSVVQVIPANLKLSSKKLSRTDGPEEVILLRTKDEAIEFNTVCGKTEEGIPAVSICATDKGGNLQVEKNAQGVIIAHVRKYTATKDGTLKDIMKEANPKLPPKLLNSVMKFNCNANPKLKEDDKSCAKIKSGDTIYLEPFTLESRDKVKGLIKVMSTRDGMQVAEFKSEGAITMQAPGSSPVIVDNDNGEIKIPMLIKAGEIHEAYEALKQTESYKALENMESTLLGETAEEANPSEKEEFEKKFDSALSTIEQVEIPPFDVDTINSKISYDAETGKAEVCGCRRGGDVGESASITAMAGAEEAETCTADACSVEIAAPKEKPKCEKSIESLLCRVQEPDKQIRLQKGRVLPGGKMLCEIKIEYSDGRHVTYSDIGCTRKVTSYIEGTYGNVGDVTKTRSKAKEEFAQVFDFEYQGLMELFGR